MNILTGPALICALPFPSTACRLFKFQNSWGGLPKAEFFSMPFGFVLYRNKDCNRQMARDFWLFMV